MVLTNSREEKAVETEQSEQDQIKTCLQLGPSKQKQWIKSWQFSGNRAFWSSKPVLLLPRLPFYWFVLWLWAAESQGCYGGRGRRLEKKVEHSRGHWFYQDLGLRKITTPWIDIRLWLISGFLKELVLIIISSVSLLL
jgi:hypothetical protein